jgi:hypothetical protein
MSEYPKGARSLLQSGWEWTTRSSWGGSEILSASDHVPSEIIRKVQAILDSERD